MLGRRAHSWVPVAAFVAALLAVASSQAGPAVYESRLNLDISNRVASALRDEGVRVTMTRTSDRTLEPDDRTGLANRLDADIFLSVHNNIAAPSATGTMIFHSIRRDGSSRLATKLRGGFVDTFGDGRRATKHTRRGDHGDYYFQLRETTMPAVLVECAFMSNAAEGRRLATDPGFRQQLADAIALGVLRYQRTLTARRPPTLEPGLTVPAPIPGPLSGEARALGATRVRLRWQAGALATGFRVYRDDRLIAQRSVQPGTAVRFIDVWAAPGQSYRYEVVPTVGLAAATGEGTSLELRATTPAISVVLDPGHGGRDPGAVRRY